MGNSNGCSMGKSNWGRMGKSNWGRMGKSKWGGMGKSNSGSWGKTNWGSMGKTRSKTKGSNSISSIGRGDRGDATIETPLSISLSLSLSISLSLSLSFSFSLTLVNAMVEEGSGSDDTSMLGSKGTKQTMSSISSMADDIGRCLNMDSSFSADLLDNIMALLCDLCVYNSLSSCGALLLSGALLLVMALLGGGALLLSCALLHICALLLRMALLHSCALLLRDTGAPCLLDGVHNIVALLLGVGGTLLLWHLCCHWVAFLHRPCGALLLVLNLHIMDNPGAAQALRNSVANL